jgi:hypothetical protein
MNKKKQIELGQTGRKRNEGGEKWEERASMLASCHQPASSVIGNYDHRTKEAAAPPKRRCAASVIQSDKIK